MAVSPVFTSPNRTYSFGPFRLIPGQLLLLEGDTPVRVGGRALELLSVLVERAGELVSKQELLARAWPNAVVEESNIKVAVATLRRALRDGRDGQRYLVNVSGRGYQFVAPVTRTDGHGPSAAPVPGRSHHLPVPPHRIVGRQPSIRTIKGLFATHRLVTLIGEGGIGKTTVAIAVAQDLSRTAPDEVRFVDLSMLTDASFVPAAVATVLGVAAHPQGPTAALVDALADRQLLLVLDSCEHVLSSVAEFISRILCEAPGVRILATSREPLRAPAETLHRLPPLSSPPAASHPNAVEALGYPAVQLFVERAKASNEYFRFDDGDAPLVSAICRKLDGIALAIELAATHADAFSLRDLCTLLDDSHRVLALERRSAFARHSSLAATLDWSYRLLTDDERTVLRRISVFCGTFSLSSAIAIAGPDCDAVRALQGLVSRSMVTIDWGSEAPGYRLLDTTRAYAASKLREAGEEDITRSKHARHLVERLAPQATHRSTDGSKHIEDAQDSAVHDRHGDEPDGNWSIASTKPGTDAGGTG